MARHPHLPILKKRARGRFKRQRTLDSLLVLGAAIALMFAARIDWNALAITDAEMRVMAVVAGVVILIGAMVPTGLALYLWHGFANAIAEKKPYRVLMPRTIDGDTIDDMAIGVRYRFANIDAPETGDNARCERERRRGEGAAAFVERELRRTTNVSVRRTFRIDQYGRRVAFVLVDGKDLGEMLVQSGFARPWRGSRRKWCGPGGGLAKIAEAGGFAHSCKACGAIQPVAPAR